MQNDYDPAKWQINLEKHGVDFLALGSVFKDFSGLRGWTSAEHLVKNARYVKVVTGSDFM
jgi:uncharacterized DUF497 family protein